MARPRIDKDAVRERMLDVAMDLAMKFGPNKLTVSDVARECDMSQSNAYRFFSSKNALYQALAHRWFADIEACMDRVSASKRSPQARLMALILEPLAIKRKRFRENPEIFKSYMEFSRHHDDLVTEHTRKIHEHIHQNVADCLRATDQSTEKLKDAAHLYIDGTLLFRDPRLLARQPADCTTARARHVCRALIDCITDSDRLDAALEDNTVSGSDKDR